ncbi:MAG: histidine phosphatase family protein [Cytophagales bacterium]|nr:histidine phosphatase family protein [Cytophagales bacterium]
MDKHLFIVRHAQAETSSPTQRDFDRELTPTGVAEACRMGGHLKQAGVAPDVVFASPAVRALTTAQLMSEQVGYDPDRVVINPALYEEYALQAFMEMIAAIPEDHASAMVVAHNPKQTYLAEYLTRTEIGSIPTAGVVYVLFENQRWAEASAGTGSLVWFKTPNGPGE